MPRPASKAKAHKGTARAGIKRARGDPKAGKLAAAQAAYKEALEQQRATGEILNVISRSPTDVQPVFEAIAASAVKLLRGFSSVVALRVGEKLHLAAFTSTGQAGDDALRRSYPRPLSPTSGILGAVVCAGAPSIIRDTEAPSNTAHDPGLRARAKARGYRSAIGVPMMRQGVAIGGLTVTRKEPGEFSAREIQILRTFADQAVIAIENARLFNETKEALERQTATGQILSSISGSMADATPVFQVIVANLRRLFRTEFAAVQLLRDGQIHIAALDGASERFKRVADEYPRPLAEDTTSGRAMLQRAVVAVCPINDPSAPAATRRQAAKYGVYDSIIAAPMLREGRVVGAIVTARREAIPFSEKQIGLLKSFADQAVIAIENARLFNETKEALERQTGTADILKVIARSPSDVQPVFDTIVRSAVRLCGGLFGFVTRFDGQKLHLAAQDNFSSEALEIARRTYPAVPDRSRGAGRAILTKSAVRIEDILRDADYLKVYGEKGGWRRVLAVPMMRDGVPLGTISVAWADPGPIPDSQVELLKTFADQAVIAIENARLFNETKEALEQQTATSEILKVISRSTTDVQPVFETIARNARQLLGGSSASLILVRGDEVALVALSTAPGAEGYQVARKAYPMSLKKLAQERRQFFDVLQTARPASIDDIEVQRLSSPSLLAFARSAGIRSNVVVPMLGDGNPIGLIVVNRREPHVTTADEIRLLETFASQAVIAIENTRLFNETKEALEQQTAISEVLRAISASPTDVTPVLETVAQRATKICEASDARIFLVEGADVRHAAGYGDIPINRPSFPLDRGTVTGRAVIDRAPVHVEDLAATAEEEFPTGHEIQRRTGHRTVLAVPLMREERALGAIVLRRMAVKPFTGKQVELLKTFADQAAIAIENVRLFHEIQEKSRQLEEASKHKSQFLASMSHELRTPLNAILGFNEMILGGIYGDVPGDMTEPLKDMQTSGKHLLRLINNVLDLAKIEAGRMELALGDYSVQDTVAGVHATLRPLAAEKGLEFQTEVPVDIPLAHGDGGRITQCLMNLAGNSLKFTKQGRVAINVQQENGLLRYSVTDTGIGIPPDKIASLFTEFKQTDATIASEFGGTGLGLSITKKFIEMHGGRIWAESEPGKGSAFRFEIPLRVGA